MKKGKNEEFISLNEELPQLYVEELEQRLETDPLMLGSLFDVSAQMGYCQDYFFCEDYAGCHEVTVCGVQY